MNAKRITLPFIFVLYLVGVLAGFALAAFSAWADLEANFYGFSRQAKTPFRGLSCPVLMGRGERREVVVEYTNRGDRSLKPNVRVELSSPTLPQSTLDFAELAPGETLRLSKTVGPANVDLKRFIFARALVYSVYPFSDEEAACGVFVLPFQADGRIVLAAWVAFSLLFGGAGAFLLWQSGWTRRKSAPFLFLLPLLILALPLALSGAWIQTILVLVLAALTLVVGLGGLIH